MAIEAASTEQKPAERSHLGLQTDADHGGATKQSQS
jgi:hypothetical protein